jgi:regulator of protease activity HflC (stomatin/prohibitin superfamily)
MAGGPLLLTTAVKNLFHSYKIFFYDTYYSWPARTFCCTCPFTLQKNEQFKRHATILRTVSYLIIIAGVLTSGLHFINPFLEIRRLDIKTQNYTMSGVHDEGQKSGDDAIRVLTSDGLEVTIDLTVLYKLIPSEAPHLIRETGEDYTDKIVRPITRIKIRDNAVYYEAIALYSTRRDEFQQRIFRSIEHDFKRRGLVLEQLLVRNITLPESVKATIEQKINAEQDAQKMQFVLLKEKQEAKRKKVEAQGIADYQRIINTGLTDQQLQYEQIKAYLKLGESHNTKVIVIGKGNTPVILNTKN